MEILQIERTDTTPKVFFDPNELMLRIRGASRPENAKKFYAPLIEWLEQFQAQKPSTAFPLNVEVKLTFLNSLSLVYITEMFQQISRIHKDGMRILIDWYLNEDDYMMREVGQEISDMTNLPFNFIEE